MRSKFKWIFTLLLALSMQFSFAQEKTVTGVVSDKTGPLPGANVVVKGSNRSAQADFDGKFSIKAKQGETLVISFVGMSDTSIKVGAANVINIKLQDGVNLDEVVVQGYGRTATKAKTIGATQTVDAKTVANRPNTNVLQSIQGQLAGTNIALASGQPGTNKIDIIIRGESSLNASNDPLYVIDGIPLTQAFFRNLNPQDIESLTVLKDAASTAVYGNRGSNGVILINTKRAGYGESLSINYSASYGTQEFRGDDYNITDARQQLKIQQLFGAGPGFDGIAPTNQVTGQPMFVVNPANIDAYTTNTNWRDIFFRTGTIQSHDLSFSSGGKNMSNFTSVGFLDQQGVIAPSKFKRFTLRSNFTGKSSNDKLNYGLNIGLTYSRRDQLEQENRAAISTNVLQNPLNGYLASAAYLPLGVYTNGADLLAQYGSPSIDIVPYMLLDLYQPKAAPSYFDETKTLVAANISYKLTKDLTYFATAGTDYTEDKRTFAIGPEAYLSRVRAQSATQPFHGLETQRSQREFLFNFVNRLGYKKTFAEKHTIDVSAYTEYLKAKRTSIVFQQIGLNPLTWHPGAGTGYLPWNTALPIGYLPTVGAARVDAGGFSYFGTAEYDYDSKFGLQASVRRDASYRFIGDNKWGTFWSVAGRWNINKENFLKDSSWITELKARASYGTTGNQNIVARGEDDTQSTIFGGAQVVRDLNSSQQGYPNAASFGVSSYANEALLWETTAQFNVGVDFRLFERLSGTFDWYSRETTDLYQNIQISAANGITSINANDGALKNQGYELSLRYDVFKNDSKFKLAVWANGAFNDNEISSLGILDNGTGRLRIGGFRANALGQAANQYFLVPYVGVNPANGNLHFLDINGNLTEAPTDADRRTTNRNSLPRYQGGFGWNASYEGFFVDASFVYSEDFWRLDSDLSSLSDPRNVVPFPVTNDLFNAWTSTNTGSNVPSLGATNIDQGAADFGTGILSDRFLRDASFIRLRNITIGYDVPSKFLKDTFIKGCRFRLQGENILTFTKWQGFDPETVRAEATGFFPTPSAYTFGVDINF